MFTSGVRIDGHGERAREAGRTRAHPPAAPTRGRTAAQQRPHPLNRCHRRGYR